MSSSSAISHETGDARRKQVNYQKLSRNIYLISGDFHCCKHRRLVYTDGAQALRAPSFLSEHPLGVEIAQTQPLVLQRDRAKAPPLGVSSLRID
ncbi:hypothetical protein GW17_00042812 [Ensete ventricosum]|nr:hypothetical protein GW17_00042812 [Ensete ventricosum]